MAQGLCVSRGGDRRGGPRGGSAASQGAASGPCALVGVPRTLLLRMKGTSSARTAVFLVADCCCLWLLLPVEQDRDNGLP